MGFDSYLEHKGHLTSPRLVIQLDSLKRLASNTNENTKYDLIILDELDSVLGQFSSRLMK